VLLVLQGCTGGPKWSALNSEIPQAEATGHCEVREQAMALRIEHGPDGKVTGVLYVDADGRQRFQKARTVCLAANSIESARLLLNSSTPQFPEGLANASGQVGANYMRSIIEFIYGQFDEPVNMHHGNPVPGFTFGESGHRPERGFAGGISLAAVGYGQPLFAAYSKMGPLGRNYAEMFPYLAGVVATGIDLPTSCTGVTLHPTEKDQYGLPVPILNIDPLPNELAMQKFAVDKAAELLDAGGARRIIPCASLPSSHNLGTNRMSRRATDGVCDAWGRAHDISNLFISDGSVFPSNTVGHPTLTIVALAIRQAEHIAEALSRGDL
jgi:choline dehydrogenase-like flavoprotein